jgi:hypothetical protein
MPEAESNEIAAYTGRIPAVKNRHTISAVFNAVLFTIHPYYININKNTVI